MASMPMGDPRPGLYTSHPFVRSGLCACRDTYLLHFFLADGGPNACARNLEKQWGTVDRAPGRASPLRELQTEAESAGAGTAQMLWAAGIAGKTCCCCTWCRSQGQLLAAFVPATVSSTALKVGGLHPGNEEAVTLDACRSTGVSTRSIVQLLRTDWAVRKPKWPEQPMPHDA